MHAFRGQLASVEDLVDHLRRRAFETPSMDMTFGSDKLQALGEGLVHLGANDRARPRRRRVALAPPHSAGVTGF